MTAILLTLSFIYAVVKLTHLIGKNNPVMSELAIPEHFSANDKFYLSEANFQMAFGVDGYLDGELKDDPRYVKYYVRVVGKSDGKTYEKVLPHHRCTEEDWAKFSPISSKSEQSM